ncbi:MAG: T9SS type A sorting domain-containing protein [Lewinellaceae bacterium]|nr:T9SS type A sorting domain-containing protein [Phaeodactylibacter sp.]MCB9036944.1 T9SS type A sorting domain-containing protein [Lewinellaceae bacterium]
MNMRFAALRPGRWEETAPPLRAREEEILPAGEAAFSLYPNPTTGQLTLAWEGRLPGQQAAIRLFDATGRVVWRQQRRLERRMELSLAGLPAGLYVLQVQAGEGSWVKRVVVRRE